MRKSLVLGLVIALGFMAGKVLSKDEPRLPSEDVMKALEKYGTPGPEHDWLKKFEGTYDVRIRATMDPVQPMRESKGRAEDRLVMNGLFLQESFQGQCPITGKSMNAVGYMGFDNAMKKYVGVYLNSIGSGICSSMGTGDGSGKLVTMHGMKPNPMTGELMKIRSVFRMVDDKTCVFEEFMTDKDGREFRALELTYTRK